MENLSFDFNYSGVSREDILIYQEKVNQIHDRLETPNEEDSKYLGWLTSPNEYLGWVEFFNRVAENIRQTSQVLIVIGIGGSYLGARAVIEAIRANFANDSAEQNNSVQVYFAGNNLNSNYLYDLTELTKDKSVSIIVASKSGSTLESAVAFRHFRSILENKYGSNARERIYIVTDKEDGVLKNIADKEGYATFSIPKNIGGRFSVLTPVGLLPITTAGINATELLKGAIDAKAELSSSNLNTNIAYQYAVIRNIFYSQGKSTELLANYEPKLHFFGEWWKQLFAESEGKNEKGLFPVCLDFTTDLHSMGQFIQDGPKNMFETIIRVESPYRDILIVEGNFEDGLEYLHGKTLDFLNQQAFLGTLKAHSEGGVPNLVFNLPVLSPYFLGKLIYTFEKACAMSAYLLEVNPFDQPGVESYKKQMYSLLEKDSGQIC